MRVSVGVAWVFVLGIVGGCSCSSDRGGSGTHDGGADGSPPLLCFDGQTVCEGDVAIVCDGMGGRHSSTDCEADGKVCANFLGCVNCLPSDRSCLDGVGHYCAADGSGLVAFDCDPDQGMVCDPDGCKGACAPPEISDSYIGCDYYPTVTLNPVWSGFDFAVAVANTSDSEAQVRVTRGTQTVTTLSLQRGALEVITLDWVSALKGGDLDACTQAPTPGSTRLVADGAYRLRSDRPVTVYQLSPLTYEIAPAPDACPVARQCPGVPDTATTQCLSYSNDASLLLPATSLTGNYTVMSWPSAGSTTSFYAVTATQNDTAVRLFGRGTVAPGAGVDGNGTGTITLQRGDVLQVIATTSGDRAFGSDLSGSRVQADKPVQVIGGHGCGFVPSAETFACDHMETAMFPSESLGQRYVLTQPTTPGDTRSGYVARIAAIDDDTQVSFDPPVHAPVTLAANQFLSLDELNEDVEVTASKPIVVAHYLMGQAAVPNMTGDPSLSLAVPVEQYRDDYIFTASQTYDSNFINLIAPSGTVITLDGSVIPSSAFAPLGSTGLSVGRHRLPSSGSESHHISAAAPFGLTVYGYGRFTSYMFPGGLDLKRIAHVPVLE